MEGLECSKRTESIINRKISLFTSKLYPTFVSTPIFWSIEKTKQFRKMKKSKKPMQNHIIFIDFVTFLIFRKIKKHFFIDHFFRIGKKLGIASI